MHIVFGPNDREGSERVVIVNEALSDKFFPGEDPIGHVLESSDGGERIVGVVGNALEAGMTDEPVAARYMLYDQVEPSAQVWFVLRTGSPDGMAALLAAARTTIAREKSPFAVRQTTTMRNV